MSKPSSANDTTSPPTIALASLDVNQLQNLKQSLEEELQQLTQSYAALRQAEVKFSENTTTLDSLTQGKNGSPLTVKFLIIRLAMLSAKPMLVPLTSSLYVPGEVTAVENVIVDVGTGYYVEKSVDDAKAYYSKKAQYVKGQLEKLAETLNSRQAALRGEQLLVGVIQYTRNYNIPINSQRTAIAEAMQSKLSKQSTVK
ncbi:Prefoldin alpha subunit [Gonapodya prolifera JEL478]|uniref:Prefoldin alpha subunit n=1 Tax=Gonapodya prolifera (strain JEL478) TaxID=1344416 RepID=A0A139AYT9_GONPJ|nr:Prefoldin alpha subunit [Gonapodya prolifera JEL478]|eukprot:KXS21901.1 Prefoldin alpha subunit [Gonapodya prolifera JEL478]